MPIVVLVPGYGGRVRAVERWRVALAVRTLAANGGGKLIVSGHLGEAQRLAALATNEDVIVESTARTTFENVECSIRYLEDAERLAIASDWFHSRRASAYLRRLRPDLGVRLVAPEYQWFRGWWVQAGGAVYAMTLAVWRAVRPVR